MNGCEFDPETEEAAEGNSLHHLSTVAIWSVGKGKKNFHLCIDCVKLPRFRRFKRRLIVGSHDRVRLLDLLS